jgi:hypothetical protein
LRTPLRVLLAVAVAACMPAANAAVTAVGPAYYQPRAGEAAPPTPPSLVTKAASATRIALAPPTAAELATLAARNAASATGAGKPQRKGPVAIAFPRDVPARSSRVPLRSLAWQTLDDGSRAARLDVASPGAAALRVALALPATDPALSVRFAGNGARAEVFGPIPANAVARDALRVGTYWSPVLEGDVATIEFHVEASAAIPDVTLAVTRVAHQVVAPSAIAKLDAKAVQDIGSAGACEIDVACAAPSAALASAAKAVAAIEFQQDDGFTHLCTGQLLNDSISSGTPYFFTANHCIDSALAAQTLNAFWFFDAIACGSKAVPPYIQQISGATLLARSVDSDWSLVRLNAPPPANATFSAWRAEPLAAFTPIVVLQHPEGDLKKWSQGTTIGYQLYTNGASFAQVQYSRGTTEPGSSGSGLLTLNPGGFYEVRGGLYQGSASCEFPIGTDDYSRLDAMLPLARQYLTPDTPSTGGTAVAVEYYNANLDHYFMTISPVEINALDTGQFVGWQRTGLRFLAYASPAPGTNPVCRFYRTPGYGDSHFYSPYPSECQTLVEHPELYPGWTLESMSVFYIAVPDPVTGACASGTQPVYRFFNQRTTNHRYTMDHATRDAMRADPATWLPEGAGPDAVIMCAPVGS